MSKITHHRGLQVFRSPDLLAASQWVGARVGDLIGHGSPYLRVTRAALADKAALSRYTSRLLEENCRGSYRVNGIGEAIVLRGTTTSFQQLTTRTARRMLECPRLAAIPITQLLGWWLPHVSIPISISWSSLRRCAFSEHNADVAVRLALHALPHPAHPASARESCIACGSGDLSLAHRYWSCWRIRPVIVEAFTTIQQPLTCRPGSSSMAWRTTPWPSSRMQRRPGREEKAVPIFGTLLDQKMEREEALERLKKKRTILRTSLSKYGKIIEEYDVHKECDHEELLGQLSDVYEELRRVDGEIDKLHQLWGIETFKDYVPQEEPECYSSPRDDEG
ncbi:hypothetical protein LAZ67_19001735 [Cordylochernes scorpioides]|uniref:Uncharacterized protein n=1 Tax=Cordylochernes scorpioides TaxID=51811 RepID=A0ABY6LHX9_9ARAC|nr:hypothetical protein LAZ67_19001735 [Cordylochernes scorpioides]